MGSGWRRDSERLRQTSVEREYVIREWTSQTAPVSPAVPASQATSRSPWACMFTQAGVDRLPCVSAFLPVSAVTCHHGTKPITLPSLTVTGRRSSAAHLVTHMHVVCQTLNAV